MGSLREAPRGTVTTPTAPASETSTTRERKSAQLGVVEEVVPGAGADVVPGAETEVLPGAGADVLLGAEAPLPLPEADGPLDALAEAPRGTSSRGETVQAAVKALTVTPSLVLVNRCRTSAPPSARSFGVFVEQSRSLQ